ncbi:MAG TPA: oligogalacturonate lyase family protein [Bryobacteraceae bacterium]|nr:oligogalacturonate lyase family protein [Bryobacteraceae bacterium]
MAKGSESPSELCRHTDSATGTEVLQLTTAPAISHATYFLQSSFTPDGRTLLFISNRTGSWQLFAVTPYPGGPIRQLTGGPPIHPFSPAIAPSGDTVFFVRAASLWRLDLVTLAETCLVDFGAGSMGEPSLDPAGEWAVAAIRKDGQSGLAVGRTNGDGWRILPYPRTVIHPQFHPLFPEWIEFAGDPAPRMHRIRRDGTGLECLYEHCNEEFIVHETFLGRTGELAYTVWPRELRRLDWQSGRTSLIAACNAWHITPSRDGSRILYDTNHPDEGIFLVDVATGQRRLVCLASSSCAGSQWKTSRYALAEDFAAARSAAQGPAVLSWMEAGTDTVYGPQWTHPHPSFSPGETHVVFASDRTGTTQVYVARIPL